MSDQTNNDKAERTSTLKANLCQFTGTENYYRHFVNRSFLYTDGVKFLAEEAQAYWLIDAIAICQKFEKQISAEEFQLWRLTVHANNSAILTCDNGNGNIVYQQKIPFTDFPLDEIRLYFTNGVLMLTSEY